MSYKIVLLVFSVFLSACVSTTEGEKTAQKPTTPRYASPSAHASFAAVVRRVEPVAETECKLRASKANCDYKILIDMRPDQPPNASQRLEKSGRPMIVFNRSLIDRAKNRDELAFVLSHEAAHHIEGHIGKTKRNAFAGAVLVSVVAAMAGGGQIAIQSASDLGGAIGARSYSKTYELEADSMGAVIAHKSGYNPVRGAVFFTRVPDPGDQFLGTHPPHADRVKAVKTVADTL